MQVPFISLTWYLFVLFQQLTHLKRKNENRFGYFYIEIKFILSVNNKLTLIYKYISLYDDENKNISIYLIIYKNISISISKYFNPASCCYQSLKISGFAVEILRGVHFGPEALYNAKVVPTRRGCIDEIDCLSLIQYNTVTCIVHVFRLRGRTSGERWN